MPQSSVDKTPRGGPVKAVKPSAGGPSTGDAPKKPDAVKMLERRLKLTEIFNEALIKFTKENGQLDAGDLAHLINSLSTTLPLPLMLTIFEKIKYNRLKVEAGT